MSVVDRALENVDADVENVLAFEHDAGDQHQRRHPQVFDLRILVGAGAERVDALLKQVEPVDLRVAIAMPDDRASSRRPAPA